ncbi:hypothetical protein Tco_0948250 [Tanacetum coccineum]
MVENQLITATEVQKHIENENESDPKVSDPKDAVEEITSKITCDSAVVVFCYEQIEITYAEEILCKNSSWARDKCDMKGR